MEVNVNNAIRLFYPNPSLEYVYFEAIANSLDAGASKIEIEISLDAFTDPDSLSIRIRDNGKGFDDENFKRFSRLLEIDEDSHKGIGRLVFLHYFKKVSIVSKFGHTQREIEFTEAFNGKSKKAELDKSGFDTVLDFAGYRKEKIKSYDYLIPSTLKTSVLQYFFPWFYRMKVEKKSLEISFSLMTKTPNQEYGFLNSATKLDLAELPDLKEATYSKEEIDLFARFRLLYSIQPKPGSHSLITAICADDRTIPVDIVSENAIPFDYEVIFILMSDYFTGKTDTSRKALVLDEETLRQIKTFFQQKVAELIRENIEEVRRNNALATETIEQQYPHLQGYFDTSTVGLVDKAKTIEAAQRKFFSEQKEILEAGSLSEEQYEKSLEVSSRILTEYILYRNIIISKLKKITPQTSESDIHSIIVPKKRTFHQSSLINDIFTNNAWLLDDKYMSYSTILSDVELDRVYSEILPSKAATPSEQGRPDITIIFSENPEKAPKVDVVVVELKKIGLELAKKEEVVSQLRQRARRLLEYYPEKIQRIWFYGIVDFDDEFKRFLLEDKYIELFSAGELFYKEQPIILDLATKKEVLVGLYVLSYSAFLNDAENRNKTFLQLLKESFKG